MKRKTLVAGGVVALIGLAGLAGIVTAHGGRDGWGGHHRGPGAMMGRWSHGMDGYHRGKRGHGMMGRGYGMRMMEQADADDDGRITAEEAAKFRTEQIETYDADGDGSLSLDEFAALHAAKTRPMVVDRFQALDDDGDGKVTDTEIASRVDRMLRFMDRDGDRRGRMGWGRGVGPMMQDDEDAN